MDSSLFTTDGFEFYGKINLLKAAILYSDRVTTVSPCYAMEIQTPQFGCGLDGLIRARRKSVTGILNGINYDIWNPRTDDHLEKKYDADEPDGKRINKQALQRAFGLTVQPDIPLFGFVGRLTHQKGIDLMMEAIPRLLDGPWQIVILGEGDHDMQEKLKEIAGRMPERLAFQFQFNENTAHRIYAGSDFFLMPSAFEPCGLSQMISLRYGTVPLVRHVGGLVDTIRPFQESGNGLVFKEHTARALGACFREALRVYQDAALFKKLRQRAFTERFPWDNSARRYEEIYEKLLATSEEKQVR